jgi:hypothetical protein
VDQLRGTLVDAGENYCGNRRLRWHGGMGRKTNLAVVGGFIAVVGVRDLHRGGKCQQQDASNCGPAHQGMAHQGMGHRGTRQLGTAHRGTGCLATPGPFAELKSPFRHENSHFQV